MQLNEDGLSSVLVGLAQIEVVTLHVTAALRSKRKLLEAVVFSCLIFVCPYFGHYYFALTYYLRILAEDMQ